MCSTIIYNICYMLMFLALLKIENKPIVKQVEGSSNSVNITWLSPANNSGFHEVILYDIQCNICVESVCNKSCTDLLYDPSQYNVTRTWVRVSGLVDGPTYQFRVFPKNSLNRVVPRERWTFAERKLFSFLSRGITVFTGPALYRALIGGGGG